MIIRFLLVGLVCGSGVYELTLAGCAGLVTNVLWLNNRIVPFIFDTSAGEILVARTSEDPAEFPQLIPLEGSGHRLVPDHATGGLRQSPHRIVRAEGILGANKNSAFAHTVGSLMIVPHNPDTWRVITSPENPQHFCLDDSITYVNGLQTSDNLSFRVAISVDSENYSSGQFQSDFIISTALVHDSIPEEMFALIDRTRLTEPDCEQYVDTLPIIQYTVMTNHSEPAVVVVLEPRDYVTIQNGYCILQITSHPSRHILGLNFLSRVGVFIDYNANRFGFCEPLTNFDL